MAEFSIRYAQAFAQVIDATKDSAARVSIAEAQSQLADFSQTLAESAPLREVLANPSIPVDQKVKVIDAIVARTKYAKPVRNFIAVLIAHDRIGAFSEIAASYAALAEEKQGTHTAEITTARDLDEASRNALESKVRSIVGGKLTATYKQDATLLGGAIIRIGSTVYDGSIRGQLARLKQTLQGA
jgi:F-type H+-transporting ATPase subunit delta